MDLEDRENRIHKRRKIEDRGLYKSVYQKKQLEEKRIIQENNKPQEEMEEQEQEPRLKRYKNSDKEPGEQDGKVESNTGVPELLMDTEW